MTLAKGLTGAAVPLGAVVLSRQVAERIEHQRLQTGLTYCGHPLACAAGLAALDVYRDEGLIERSRHLGGEMFAELQTLAARHEVIGEVRGGHGLFAVVELVRDRASRKPHAPWPELAPAFKTLLADAMRQGVSFAARGNLLILAPPLVVAKAEIARALGLLDTLLSRHFSPPSLGDP